MQQQRRPQFVLTTKLANWLAASLLILVPFHAFLTVWIASLASHYTLLRLWNAAVLLAILAIASFWLLKDKGLRQEWARGIIPRLILAYVLLHLLFAVVAILKNGVEPKAVAYGMLVNLRYLAWFLAVCVVAHRSPFLHRYWRPLLLLPACGVVIFAAAQYTVLPHNFLGHFGYHEATTIAPIETINNNSAYIRVQSTLRGANPLGAYLVIIVSALAALALKGRRLKVIAAGVVAVFALYASGSRSAWAGSVFAVATILWINLEYRKKLRKRLAIVSLLVIFVLTGALSVLLRTQSALQNAILHTQEDSNIAVSSNDAHASAVRQGLSEVVREPLGEGPGTAGPASVYDTPHPPRIAENYYVQIAQETGWVGLMLYVVITGLVARELYRRRGSALGLLSFASLLGITIVCMLSHAWTDDTLAFIWWGMAGIALASPRTTKTGQDHA